LIGEFNRIFKLQEEAKVSKFNNILPTTIEVLEKVSHQRYLIKFSNKEISTKSMTKLKLKTKYWVELKTNKNSMQISNLLEQPYFMQNQFNSFILDGQRLKELIKLPNFNHKMKLELLEQLQQTSSRDEFEFLNILLTSYKNGITSLPLMRKNKLELVQIKRDIKNDIYQFYIATNNIGPIGGYMAGDNLYLFCAYNSTLNFLTQNISMCKNSKINNISFSNVKPLFDNNDIGLNIRV
jgi:hypothetical protein